MRADDTLRAGRAPNAPRGDGHIAGWTCPRCAKPQMHTLGRKLRRWQGLRTWVCASCVRMEDAQRTAA